jgi:dihydroorotate dehydrogenase
VRVYGWTFRTVLCRIDAERVHRLSFGALRAIAALPGATGAIRRVCRVPDLPVDAMGLRFANPLGLAAGFDKDAVGIGGLAALGFGFVEVGTVTGRPQPGNPRPRVFRLPRDRAIVNRMGFNSRGAAHAARRLARWRRRHPRGSGPVVGVNIGRTRAVDDAHAIDDYVTSAALVAPYADYLVVNVSSPNTPGLRDLQAVDQLRPLLIDVGHAATEAAGRRVPLLVKIAPELADDDILAVADLAVELGLDGIVATNTTTGRDRLVSTPEEVAAAGAGGLSGPPLRDRSLAVLRLVRDRVGPEMAVLSVGGIDSADETRRRLAAGATLVQAYTGLIYGGPLWPSRVIRELSTHPVTPTTHGGRR